MLSPYLASCGTAAGLGWCPGYQRDRFACHRRRSRRSGRVSADQSRFSVSAASPGSGEAGGWPDTLLSAAGILAPKPTRRRGRWEQEQGEEDNPHPPPYQ